MRLVADQQRCRRYKWTYQVIWMGYYGCVYAGIIIVFCFLIFKVETVEIMKREADPVVWCIDMYLYMHFAWLVLHTLHVYIYIHMYLYIHYASIYTRLHKYLYIHYTCTYTYTTDVDILILHMYLYIHYTCNYTTYVPIHTLHIYVYIHYTTHVPIHSLQIMIMCNWIIIHTYKILLWKTSIETWS